MNWSIMMVGMAMGCGGFATQPPPDVVFSVTPRRDGAAGSITTVIDYKNAPGGRVEISIYQSVRHLGLLVPDMLALDTTKAELPKGCYGVNFVGLPRGCPVTHALVEVKDQCGNVMARKWLDGLHVIVP